MDIVKSRAIKLDTLSTSDLTVEHFVALQYGRYSIISTKLGSNVKVDVLVTVHLIFTKLS